MYDDAEQNAEKEDYATAAAQFSRYVQFRPGDAVARARLAKTYDLAYSERGGLQRAIELYREALGLAAEQQKAPILARLGELLLKTGKYVDAAEAAETLLQQDPKNVQAANLLAKALYGQVRQGSFKGKPGEIGASFERALSQDPGNRDTAATLARIYREEPQYLGEKARTLRLAAREKAADQIIDRLVAAHPEQPEGHFARYQYRLQYHLPGADDDLKEARRLGPANIEVLLTSADAFRREAAGVPPSPAAADKARSLREAARGSYEKAVTVAAYDYRGYFGLGVTERELGQPQAAIDAWNRGLQSAPAATNLFDMLLAGELLKMGRFDDAEKHLDRLAKQFEKARCGSNPFRKSPIRGKIQASPRPLAAGQKPTLQGDRLGP